MSKNSSTTSSRLWWCSSCFSSVTFRKRIVFYICIFLYYIVQLSLFQKDPSSDGTDDKGYRQLNLFLEISLFLFCLIILLLAWIFRPIFDKYSLLWDSTLVSLSIVWLVINIPAASESSFQCIINFLILFGIFYIDSSVQLNTQPQAYMYPWILAKNQSKLKKGSKKSQKVGKKSLFSVSMWNVKKNNKQKNNKKVKTRKFLAGYELAATVAKDTADKKNKIPLSEKGKGTHEFFESQEQEVSSQNSAEILIEDDEELQFSVDLERQSSLPLSAKDLEDEEGEDDESDENQEDNDVEADSDDTETQLQNADNTDKEENDFILKNFHFDLASPAALMGNTSHTSMNNTSTTSTASKALCSGFRINVQHLPTLNPNIPNNIVWSDFVDIRHIVDSSSCHIYVATWLYNNPYLAVPPSDPVPSKQITRSKQSNFNLSFSSRFTRSFSTSSNLVGETAGNGESLTDLEAAAGATSEEIPQGMTVVIKLIKAERTSSAVAVSEFEIEENVLSRIAHPNIIRLLGSGNVPRKFLILECLNGGSLSHVLGLRPVEQLLIPNEHMPVDAQDFLLSNKSNVSYPATVMISQFNFLEILQILCDLAKALNYLHYEWCDNIHIIHRDLKPDNIGFNAAGKLKLFDFGLCAVVRAQREKSEPYKLTGNTGTLRYMAPEVVLGRSYHQSVDVYSFGILAWQIASMGKVPFADLGKKVYYDKVVVGGQRLKLPTKWPSGFHLLLKSCWAEDKNARPSFPEVLRELEHLIAAEERVAAWKQSSQWMRKASEQMKSGMWSSRPMWWLGAIVLIGFGFAGLKQSFKGFSLPLSILLLLIGWWLAYYIFMTYFPSVRSSLEQCWKRLCGRNNNNNINKNTAGTATPSHSHRNRASSTTSVNSSTAMLNRQKTRLNSLDSTGPSTPYQAKFAAGSPRTPERNISRSNGPSSTKDHRIKELEDHATSSLVFSGDKKVKKAQDILQDDDDYNVNPLYRRPAKI